MILRGKLPAALRPVLIALSICMLSSPARAVLRLGAPFGEHMVLPRDVPVTLWGTGAPAGDTVRVAIQGQTAVGHAEWDGHWLVRLEPMHSGGPFQLNVAIGGLGPIVPTPAANATVGLEVNDVLVGDVFPLSQLMSVNADRPTPSSTTSASLASLHPYAFVRVYTPANGAENAHWTAIRQEIMPPGLQTVFTEGSIFTARTHVPVGVLRTAPMIRCPPSTACSAH